MELNIDTATGAFSYGFTFPVEEVRWHASLRRYDVRYHRNCWTVLPKIEVTPRVGDMVTLWFRAPTWLGYPLLGINLNGGPYVPREEC